MGLSDEQDPLTDDWTLISVSFNSSEQLRSSWSDTNTGSARWLVVDNASTDDSVAVAERLGAEVVPLTRNVGFGRANNRALAAVDTPWTMFVNPDVRVRCPADLNRLATVSRLNGSLIAPQLVNPDGSVQPNARGLPFLVDKIANRGVRLPGARLDDYAATNLVHPTYAAWAIGAAVGGPTEAFREIGGWDEQFFVYYEDHDLGLRAWRAGIPLVIDPAVRWAHEWQRATQRLRFAPWMHELASMRRFYTKYPELMSRSRLRRRGGEFGVLNDRLWTEAWDLE